MAWSAKRAPRRRRGPRLVAAAAVLAFALLSVVAGATAPALAQVPPGPLPDRLVDPAAQQPGAVDALEVPAVPSVGVTVTAEDEVLSRGVLVILLLTVGSVAPGLLMLMTSFTRFIIILGLAKSALGLQTVPPAQVLVGLAAFLTFFVMAPVFSQVNEEALQPFLSGDIGQDEAFETGFAPLREFMLAQTREDDLRLFIGLSGAERPASVDDVPASTLIPAFVVSELRTAFVIGFVVFVPFLVIDLVVAAVLMSMGMVMLPPVFISMPIKLLLFVLVDGWGLLIGSMVGSVQAVPL